MAENIKNLCAPIPTELHAQLRQRQEESGQTLSQYMTWLITKFYESEGKSTMKENQRTIAFQVSTELFKQFKDYLQRKGMGILTDWITDWLKELLIDGIMGNLGGLFDNVNAQSLLRLLSLSGTAAGRAVWRKRS